MGSVNDDAMGSAPSSEGAPLGFLVDKLRDLTLKNQELESHLELANRKLAFYESFDSSIRDAVTHSLRVACEIRAKSEQEAKELLERTKREEALLREETVRLAAERDGLLAEWDTLNKSVQEVRGELEREKAWREERTRERAQVLSEVTALEDRLKRIRDDLVSVSDLQDTGARPEPLDALSRPATRPVSESRPPVVPITNDAPSVVEEKPSVRADYPTAIPQPAIPDVWQIEDGMSFQQTDVYDPPAATPHPEVIAIQPEGIPIQPQAIPIQEAPLRGSGRLDFSAAVVPSPFLPIEGTKAMTQGDRFDQAHAVFPMPIFTIKDAEPVTRADRGDYVSSRQSAALPLEDEKLVARADQPGASSQVPPRESNGDVELVISPVHSFPKLVELERALQSLREVKSFYVRDFRYGVATLLIRLTGPEFRDELPMRLEGLPGWNLVILSCPPNRIEAKIGA